MGSVLAHDYLSNFVQKLSRSHCFCGGIDNPGVLNHRVPTGCTSARLEHFWHAGMDKIFYFFCVEDLPCTVPHRIGVHFQFQRSFVREAQSLPSPPISTPYSLTV